MTARGFISNGTRSPLVEEAKLKIIVILLSHLYFMRPPRNIYVNTPEMGLKSNCRHFNERPRRKKRVLHIFTFRMAPFFTCFVVLRHDHNSTAFGFYSSRPPEMAGGRGREETTGRGEEKNEEKVKYSGSNK